ncbi:MAG TPA: CotH kinase family protein [Methylomirabilota bacterium]|nr:CotH kinase family protein [Methylomirabilota bacterium]
MHVRSRHGWALRWTLMLTLMTPGAAVMGAEASADAPEFSVAGGIFTNALTVQITSRSPNATIRYTLDGTEPRATSATCTGPLIITNPAFVRARAFAPGLTPSEVKSRHYLVLAPDALEFSSNLPLVILHSFGQPFDRERRRPAALSVIEPGPTRARLTGPAAFDGRALANIRGRASLRYPKRSYTVKLVDEHDGFLKAPILGMPKDSDWVLYAPYPDKTLMRDVLAYELSNQIGEWAPRTRFVEVFVNESGGPITMADYVGVYVFEERVRRGKDRVNIAALDPDALTPPAITGGYIFKKDHVDRGYYGEPDLLGGGNTPSSTVDRPGLPSGPGGFPANPAGFLPSYAGSRRSSNSSSSSSSRRRRTAAVTNQLGAIVKRESGKSMRVIYVNDDERIEEQREEGFQTALATNQFYYVDPEEDEINAAQRAWLRGHLDAFEQVLYGPAFRDPTHGYAAWIDPGSFIDHHLIVEVTKNVDGFRFSTFYHKDRGGKIRAGPIWDWNLSFGNANGKQGWMPEHWLWPQLDDKEYTWYRRLFDDPDFGQRYVDRWTELRKTVFATDRLLRRVDEIAALLHEAQARNFERWPILGQGVNPNWFVGVSYADEVRWMKEWIANRLNWIEEQFPAVPEPSVPAAEIASGASFKLRTAAGTVHYTLDGSDPRGPDGQPAAKARTADEAIKLDPGQTLLARTWEDGRWSGPLRIAR